MEITALFGDGDRRHPLKQNILPHVGVLRFYLPLTETDIVKRIRKFKRYKLLNEYFSMLYNLFAPADPAIHCDDRVKLTGPRDGQNIHC